MRTAEWGELDPEAKCYGAMRPENGWVSPCTRTLVHGVELVDIYDDDEGIVLVAWIDGEHVLVPDEPPPSPEPVVTVDGHVVEPMWFVRRPDGSMTGSPRSFATARTDVQVLNGEYGTSGYVVAAVVLLPEEGT